MLWLIIPMTITAYWSKRRVVTSSSFSELITTGTQLREFHMVSPELVFTFTYLSHHANLQVLPIVNVTF